MKNTKYPIVLLLLLAQFPNSLFAERSTPFYPVSEIADELANQAHSVIRHEKAVFEVKGLDKAVYRYEMVVTLLNENSPYSDVFIAYDESFYKTEVSGVYIYDKHGAIVRKIKKKELSDHSSNQGAEFGTSRFFHAKASHHEYPYTVSYKYEQTISMTMFYPDWNIIRNYYVSVESSEFVVKVPSTEPLRFQLNNIEAKPKESTEEGLKVYHFKKENILAFQPEPLSPIEEELFPSVIFAPSRFEVANYRGDMSTWERLSRFSYQLNKDRDILSPVVQQQVRAMVAGVSSKEEKIKILYRYLQKNMRYVSVQMGVGGWQTFNAEYVQQNKYGDCKALSNYMKSLLKTVGIESHTALIKTGRDERDQWKDFSSSDFNHVILYIPEAENIQWLECTSSDLPPGVVGDSNADRYALIVKPQGGQLLRTPQNKQEDNVLLSEVTLKLNDEGAAQIIAQQTAKAAQEGIYRYYANNMSKEDQEKLLRKILTLSNFNINDYQIQPSLDAYETQINIDLSIPKYASKAGKRLFFVPNVINQSNRVPRMVKNRQFPLENRAAYTDTDLVNIALPPSYRVENIPENDIKIETDFGKYEMTITEVDGQLQYKRYMVYKAFKFPKERYEDYRAFMKAVAKADKMKVVLVKAVP